MFVGKFALDRTRCGLAGKRCQAVSTLMSLAWHVCFVPPTLPINSVQAGYGYKDHVVKPAEVRRNDAVGLAAGIPY